MILRDALSSLMLSLSIPIFGHRSPRRQSLLERIVDEYLDAMFQPK